MRKLYVVTRGDLSPGQQAVQACHAGQEFIFEHPREAESWHLRSNTLALLVLPSEAELESLARAAEDLRVPVTRFREPDRDNELTAIALGYQAQRLVSRLPLALKA
jgi:peptidyl-tRNA hydrolase